MTNAAALTSLAIETKNGALDISFTGGTVAFVQPGVLDRLSLSSSGMDFTFSNTGGKVVLDGVNAGTGAVSITAKTSIDDTASTLTGGTVTLKAGTSIGSSANKINTDLGSLTATANAGGIFIADSGAINSLTATAKGSGNDVEVSTVGDLIVAKVTAPDAVTLTAGGSGNIKRSGSVLNVSGASVTLQAGAAIGTSAEPMVLDVATLTLAKADAGGNFLRFKSAVNATEVRATGDVEMSSDVDITIGVVAAGGANTVKITSAHGTLRDGNAAALNISGGTANLTANQIGTFADPIDTDIGTLTAVGNSGGVYINELNALTVVSVVALGQDSHINLSTGGDMLLSVVKAEGDQVKLSTIGRINDGNGPLLNITADLLDISATTGIDTLQNSVNRLGSASGGSGGVTISNIGPISITDATLEGKGPSMLTIQAESITVLDMDDNLASLDLNGSLKLEALNGNVIFLDPNDTIAASGTGSLTISAAPGFTPLYPNTGAVAVVGNLTTAGGSISVLANHHITIGFLNTGGTGDVSVISQTGVIIDGNGTATNIRAKIVTLSGVGQTARQAELETTIRIADYSAIRSEAAAKLTSAQSFFTAAAIMDIQQQNALDAKGQASSAKSEAEQLSNQAASAADSAATLVTTLNGVAVGLTIAADVAQVVAAVAQAIPLSGDGGASVVATALSVGADVATTAAFFAALDADKKAGEAGEAADALAQAGAELTALSATYEDSLATWRAFDEATSIAQKAADAAAIARDHALVVRDQAIYAEDQANVIGTTASGLQIEAEQINATATDGSVFLSVTGDVKLGSISATGTGGVVSVKGDGNIYVRGTTVAPSQVLLDAGLSIIQDGGSIDAPEFLGLALNNVGTIAAPILTTINTLAVHAVNGTVGISNTGPLKIGSVNENDGVTAAGAVGITSSGSLTFEKTISAPGQVVTLLSQNGAIIDDHADSAEVTALTLNATAKSGIELDTNVSNLSANVTDAGSVEIREADGITLTSVQTADGAISVEAGGTIVATSVISTTDADTNDITLKATNGGGIQAGTINAGTVDGDVTLDASTAGGTITMLGGGRITADAFVATTASGINVITTANSADLEVTGTGAIVIDESNALLVNKLTTEDGAINLKAGGQVTLVEGAVNAEEGDSDVTIEAAGKIVGPLVGNGVPDVLGAIVNLITTGAGNTIGTSSANALEINATSRLNVTTAGSNAFIEDTEGGVVIGLANVGSGNFLLKALAGSITSVSPGNNVADIVAAHVDLKVTGETSTIGTSETSQLDINGSTLTLLTEGGSAFLADTAGGIAINTLNVGAGNIFLTATGGAITDNDGTSTNNIVATNLMLSATAGVGTGANPIEVTVTALEGLGGSGGFALTDLSGGILIGGVTSALTGVSVTGGNIAITALSPLTVNEAVANTGGGNITLTATDSEGEGDDLTVNANLTATGGTGGITLYGGDDVTLKLGVTLSAPGGTVDIHGDNGDADEDIGSNVQLDGSIRASRLQITTAGDNDTVVLKDAIVSSQAINTGGGNDEITIAAGNTLGTGTLNAGTGDDTVTISSAVQIVLGNDGEDTIHVFAQVTTLNAGDDDDAIDISATVGTFIGGLGEDILLMKAGGAVSTSADGGGDYDQFIYDHDDEDSEDEDDYIGPVTVNLQTGSATGLTSFTGFERFEATTHANDRLIGANIASTWHITDANAGDIGGAGVFDFSGFENLTGGTNDDAFLFAEVGEIAGDLDGGGHAAFDTIDYDGADFGAEVTVILDGPNAGTATAIEGRFDRINKVIGDEDYSATNDLTGDNTAAVWTFTGVRSGNINDQFFFQEFGDITGGNGGNSFAFADGSIPSGTINGGSGYNILDLSDWSSDLAWFITDDNAGHVDTIVGTFGFAEMSRLISGEGNDRFIFSDDKILGGELLATGAIVGNGGTDFIDLSAYTTRNLWSRTELDGTIETDRETWTYSSIEQFLGSETTTYLFDVVAFVGYFRQVILAPQVLPGQVGGVFLNVTNIGNDEVLRQPVEISFYLSLDDKLDPSDIVIGTNDSRKINANLYQGATGHTFFTSTTIPEDAAPGVYHLLSYLDSGNVVAEGDEMNNLVDGGLIEVLPVVVDLQPEFTKSTLPTEVIPGTKGAKGVLTTVVTNIGNSPAIGAVDVEFFLSLDTTIGMDDIALGGFFDRNINLSAGESRTFTLNAQIPESTVPGNYHVLTRVDGKNMVVETDESNNVAEAEDMLQVNLPYVDLVADVINADLPNIGVPNDTISFQVPIKNIGNIPANGKIDVDFYLSVDGTVDPGSDVLIKSMSNVSIKLGPDGQRVLSATAKVPASILGGTFFVLADIDTDNAIEELNDSNNSASSDNFMEVVWRFGNLGDRKNVKLVVPDANGNIVTFSMKGEGAGDIMGGSNFTELSLVGTNPDTKVFIKTKKGAITQLHDIIATNPIEVLKAPKANLQGNVVIPGGFKTMILRDVSDSTMTIGEPHDELMSIRLAHVTDLTLTSGTPIHSLKVLDWRDTNMTRDFIQAPHITSLRSAGDFQADIITTDVSRKGLSLTSMKVKGVANSNVVLAGGVHVINVGGWDGGSFAATFADRFVVRGDMEEAELTLSGAGLTSNQKALGTLRVSGAVTDTFIDVRKSAGVVRAGTWGAGSTLIVGVDSGGDGTYFDDNEIATGGTLTAFYSKTYSTLNSGTTFGIVVDVLANVIQLNRNTKFQANVLPFVDGDLKVYAFADRDV